MEVRKVSVENFGPIRRGCVELDNLTVIIGPQNSGKTYLATLLYALINLGYQVVSSSILEGIIAGLRAQGHRGLISYDAIHSLTEKDLSYVAVQVADEIKRRSGWFASGLARSFLTDQLRRLVTVGSNEGKIAAEYDVHGHAVSLTFVLSDTISVREVSIDENAILAWLDESKPELMIHERGWGASYRGRPMWKRALFVPVERLVVISSFFSYISLLLAFQRGLESTYVRELLKDAGLRVRDPLLDYINDIGFASYGRRIGGSVLNIGDFMVENGRIWYTDDKGVKLPIEATSSGVAQLVGMLLPLAIYKPETLTAIIIEEPEINLHIDLHITVTKYLAELSKKCKVFTTTHSHYILAELSNLITSDKLHGVRAYLIDPKKGEIEDLRVDKVEGIEVPRTIERALSILASEALRSPSERI